MAEKSDWLVKRAEGLLASLRNAGVSSDDMFDGLDSLVGSLLEVEDKTTKNESARVGRHLRVAMIVSSTALVLVPILPIENAFAAAAVGTLGAIGYATALFDVYGEKAFEAGRSLHGIFSRSERTEIDEKLH